MIEKLNNIYDFFDISFEVVTRNKKANFLKCALLCERPYHMLLFPSVINQQGKKLENRT